MPLTTLMVGIVEIKPASAAGPRASLPALRVPGAKPSVAACRCTCWSAEPRRCSHAA